MKLAYNLTAYAPFPRHLEECLRNEVVHQFDIVTRQSDVHVVQFYEPNVPILSMIFPRQPTIRHVTPRPSRLSKPIPFYLSEHRGSRRVYNGKRTQVGDFWGAGEYPTVC